VTNTVPDHKYTLRQFLIMRSLNRGATWPVAIEAVSSCLIANPDWDGEEENTYMQWEDKRL